MARPSPRTVGKTIDEETGEVIEFQKFGTQQLKFIDPAKPALGVKQLNVGQTFKGITTTPVRVFKETFGFSPFGAPTVRDTAYPDLTITKAVGTTTPPAFPKNGNGEDCGWFGEKCWENGNGEDCGWFGEKCWGNGNGNGECDVGCLLTGRGCDCGCKDMKPCTTCDSDICKECDAWDIQCEDCRKKDGTCTPPPETKTMLFWAKIIAVVIGIGVFLWLLRPLFSRGSKPTGGFTIIPQ